jgi:hypothetical protein
MCCGRETYVPEARLDQEIMIPESLALLEDRSLVKDKTRNQYFRYLPLKRERPVWKLHGSQVTP